MICLDVLSYVIMFLGELFEKIHNFNKDNFSKKMIMISSAIVFIIIMSFAFSLFFKNGVKAEENELLHKYYTVITIEEGDSLWQYAEEYAMLGYDSKKAYIEEVRQINHIDNVNDLVFGKTIVLPYYSYEVL